MTLHTLNASPASAAFANCLQLIAPGDAILLIGDGVYGALRDTPAAAQLEACGAELYVLCPDAAAAGVLERIGSTDTVDMDGFVQLTERFPRQLAWY